MSVLDRAALEQSPLADLHAIASELSIDGYRRLRRPDLIDAILDRQKVAGSLEPAGGDELAHGVPTEESERPRLIAPESVSREDERPEATRTGEHAAIGRDQGPPRRRRGRRGGRGRTAARVEAASEDEAEREASDEGQREADEEDRIVEGTVELLPNGSGFVRVDPPEPSEEDVYISAAQVKRCELVSGDRISGPRRAARRSERFDSLVRVESVNGRPADERADTARFDDLPAAFPNQRFTLATEDPTVKAIEAVAPFGKGSRITIVGGWQAGKSEALRRLGIALARVEDIDVLVALAGVRPEEIDEWTTGPLEPGAAVSFDASADAQGQAVERIVEQSRRLAARGADAVVLIDTLDGLHPHAARKALAAARNIVDGGSVTVIATARAPLGGETTVIALDATGARTGRFPALDVLATGTMRVDSLVGESGAQAIARARARGDRRVGRTWSLRGGDG